MKFRSRAVEVTAVRLAKSTKIETIEGEELAKPGDWLITGVKNEHWPVSDEVFHQTYDKIPGKIERFRKKTGTVVEAEKLEQNTSIKTSWGKQSGKVGDWLITSHTGDVRICAADVFELTYEPVG